MSYKLILASRSPRRQQLLGILGIPFQIQIADIDESRMENESPSDMVARLSTEKATKIAEREKDVVVIGADTIVVLDERILEKPATPEDAREMLSSLSSKTHIVYTGVSVTESGENSVARRQLRFVEKTLVTFGEITDDQIDHYIASGSPFDKAGGYGIQDDRGALFVEKIDGDFYNVMGLPIFRLNQLLQSEFASLFAGK
jgi:septum formation protein